MYSHRNYVTEQLFPDSYVKQKMKNKKTDERKSICKEINLIISECCYACFVFSLKQFFEEGTKTAKEAVSVLHGLGINKFYIGKKDYSKDNKNVNEGKMLYEIMINSISDKKLKDLIKKSNYYSDIIKRYKNVLLI